MSKTDCKSLKLQLQCDDCGGKYHLDAVSVLCAGCLDAVPILDGDSPPIKEEDVLTQPIDVVDLTDEASDLRPIDLPPLVHLESRINSIPTKSSPSILPLAAKR